MVGVLRVQLLTARYLIGVPLAALGVVMALDLTLFAAIGPVAHPQDRYTGALETFGLTVCAVHAQVTGQTFRLALGMGVTRRAFCSALAVLAGLEALGYGALLVLLQTIERATGGWGIELEFFRLDQLGGRADPVLLGVAYAALVLVLAVLGSFIGAVFARWAAPGLYGLVVCALVLPAVAALLITGVDRWGALVAWVLDQPPVVLSTAYPLVLAVLLGGAGWLVLRRATA